MQGISSMSAQGISVPGVVVLSPVGERLKTLSVFFVCFVEFLRLRADVISFFCLRNGTDSEEIRRIC